MRAGIALVFVLALLAGLAAGCGGGEEVAPLPETVVTNGETGTATEGETDTETATETETGEEPAPGDGEGEGEGDGDAGAGRQVFDEAGCGGCHALADAQSTATIGVNLDQRRPSAEEVAAAVRTGPGAMPSFEGQLDDEQIANVSAYVAGAAGGGGE